MSGSTLVDLLNAWDPNPWLPCGHLLLFTRHLPVHPGKLLYSASTCLSRYTSYLYLASTCIFRYTSMLGIYLFIQVHFLSILGIYTIYPGTLIFSGSYLYIQVHIYTWHLTCIIRYSSILGICLYIQVHHCTRLLPMYPGTLIYSELPVYPGTLYTWHLPVSSSKLL